MNVLLSISIYVICLNILGFFIMGIDKYKAKKRAWRIPEATLFAVALFGGSLGSILGMYTFRHKTRHWYFVYGMPFILLMQLVVFYLISHSAIEILLF